MLQTYIGTKVVKGEPQTCQKDDHNSKVGDPGYKVVYEDGYISWSPKEVFEKAYRKTDGMTFGLAVEAMKIGLKVHLSDWNPKFYLSIGPNGDPSGMLTIHINVGGAPVAWPPNPEEILEDKWQIWGEK